MSKLRLNRALMFGLIAGTWTEFPTVKYSQGGNYFDSLENCVAYTDDTGKVVPYEEGKSVVPEAKGDEKDVRAMLRELGELDALIKEQAEALDTLKEHNKDGKDQDAIAEAQRALTSNKTRRTKLNNAIALVEAELVG